MHQPAYAPSHVKHGFICRLGSAVGCLAVAVCMACAVPSASVAQDCDKPASVQDMIDCENIRLRAAERAMGEVYGRLLDSPDKQFAADARKAQEAWMRWREAEGALTARTANDPAMATLARKKLEAQMTEDRIRDLKTYEE